VVLARLGRSCSILQVAAAGALQLVDALFLRFDAGSQGAEGCLLGIEIFGFFLGFTGFFVRGHGGYYAGLGGYFVVCRYFEVTGQALLQLGHYLLAAQVLALGFG
jgi:hypothetical protein